MSEIFSFLTNVCKRKSVSKQLVISFPRATEKRMGVIRLPDGPFWFIVKAAEVEGKRALVMEWQDGAEKKSETLGVFHSEEDAAAALKAVRWRMMNPLGKIAIGVVVAFMAVLVIEWLGANVGGSGDVARVEGVSAVATVKPPQAVAPQIQQQLLLQQQVQPGVATDPSVAQQYLRIEDLNKLYMQKVEEARQRNAAARGQAEVAATGGDSGGLSQGKDEAADVANYLSGKK